MKSGDLVKFKLDCLNTRGNGILIHKDVSPYTLRIEPWGLWHVLFPCGILHCRPGDLEVVCEMSK